MTTERTLTGRTHALRGASKYRYPALSRFHASGEKGERAAVALSGDRADPGEQRGDCGMRYRLAEVAPADGGQQKEVAEGGGTATVSDGRRLQWQKEQLLAEEGAVVGVLPTENSSEEEELLGIALSGAGLRRTGVRALRKSV